MVPRIPSEKDTGPLPNVKIGSISQNVSELWSEGHKGFSKLVKRKEPTSEIKPLYKQSNL
jgi:hypothetical protein